MAAGALGAATATAQTDGERSKWSNPETWDGSPPERGDKVTIEEGDHVVLDTSPPPLNGVLVNGTLEFADGSIVESTDDSNGDGGDDESSDSGDGGDDSSSGDGDGNDGGGSGSGDGGDTGAESSCAPAWDPETVYRDGDEATYDGTRWEAEWWTRGDEPGARRYGPWTELGPCEETGDGGGDGESAEASVGVDAPETESADDDARFDGDAAACAQRWRPSDSHETAYRSGDVVSYGGKNWEAQWYTQDDEPGEAQVWQEVESCSIVPGGDDGEDVDLELTTTWLLAEGSNALVRIGSEDDPYEHDARIALVGLGGENVRGEGAEAIGTKLLGTWDGGSIEIHGASRDKTDWTQLDAHADAGTETLTLANAADWEAGDRIAIAPSGSDPWQAERRTVASVSGNQVTLEEPLDHDHYGAVETHAGTELDMRAEVGLLTRNVELRGDDLSYADRDRGVDSEYAAGFGGHAIFADPGRVRIEGLEAFRCGQSGLQARYPLHFHHAGDQEGSYLRHNSVWHSFNRGINAHGTGNVEIERNVVFDTIGHSYLVEQGLPEEEGNVFRENLAMLTKVVRERDRAFGGNLANPGDVRRRPKQQNAFRPAAFWISNPNNTLVGNHAAGGYGAMGFFYDGHDETDVGLDAAQFDVQFEDNVAHSYSVRPQRQLDGYTGDVGEDELLRSWRISHYQHICQGIGLMMQLEPMEIDPDEIPSDRSDRLAGFTAYKCEHSGVWTEFQTSVLEDSVIADFNIGHFAMGGSETRNTVFVGRDGTDNDIAPPPTRFKTGGPDLEGPAMHDATNGGRYEKAEPTTSNVEYVDVDRRHNSRLTPSARTTDE
ncbi:G8 domain-containing protein [Halosimplex carlsbadense 2-9-1]|uniref:G8 domain-containing protein n=1 Tax=Halosimplex carlsbadense 2-9-1 TaxID=797114 RepID=M0CNU7_9EURY|nr:G8 domain-containing protein [Halosimplex carlsbadense 2-9-1]